MTAPSELKPQASGDRKAHSGPAKSAAAERALREAAARRRDIDAIAAAAPREKNGRGGLEPGRYGDWEIKGLTSDF